MSPRMEHDSDVVRGPLAWRIRPGEGPAVVGRGSHCEGRRGTRRCKDPVAVVTWRWYRSTEVGRVLVSERFLCDEHAAEFAARHKIEIEPPFPGETGEGTMSDREQALEALRGQLDELKAALALWETRDSSRPQPDVRVAANTAMDAIDATMRELYGLRSDLVSEIREADDRAEARRREERASTATEP